VYFTSRWSANRKLSQKDYLSRFCQLLPGLVFVGALDFIADLIEKDIVLGTPGMFRNCHRIACRVRAGGPCDADFSFANLTASLLRFIYFFTPPSQLVVDV
jgi:hypothetical protein